jgi:hypothetical protein
MSFYMTRFSLFLLAIMISVITSSCSDSSTSTNPTNAKLMVVHASPDAPGVDIAVDNNKISTSALTFPNNSGYVSVAAGTRNIKVFPAGSSTSLFSADIPFLESKFYSVFALDSLSKISLLLVEDAIPAVVTGKAHVRFLHLSPNAPAVDVAVKDGPSLFLNRSFNRQFSSSQNVFLPVDAGTYNIDVKVAGTTTVALPLTGIKFESGKAYTVFASGFLGGTGVSGLGAQIIVNR